MKHQRSNQQQLARENYLRLHGEDVSLVELDILDRVFANPARVTLMEIAKHLGMTEADVSEALENLAGDYLIRRVRTKSGIYYSRVFQSPKKDKK